MRKFAVQLGVVLVLLGAAVVARAQYYTTPSPIKAVTNPATNVSDTAATLNGTVNTGGNGGSYKFDIGLAAGNYTSSSPPTAIFTSTDQDVSATLTGLTPGTTYHYRVTLTVNGTTALGADVPFTTTGTTPTTPPTTVPVPVPVPVPRTTPRLTDTVSPKSDPTPPYTYTIGGSIQPGGTRRSIRATPACSGKVSIQIKHGKRTISNRRTSVKSNCGYKLKVKLHANRKVLGRKGKLKIRPRFLGNDVLKPKNGKTITVRYGH